MYEVRGALRFRLEAKKNRTIFTSNLQPQASNILVHKQNFDNLKITK